MSQERRKRQQKRDTQSRPKPPVLRKVLIIIGILAAFTAVFFLGLHKKHSKYDAFAQCLSSKGAKMYGAFWCPHCKEQKEDFGPSFDDLNYVECGVKGDFKAQSEVCKQAAIKHYPTWEFGDHSRVEGKQTFQYLGEKTGCPVP